MPYTEKGAKECTQSDGTKGKYYTKKKGKPGRCYKSEDNYKAAMAWSKEADENDEDVIQELMLRRFISEVVHDILQPVDAELDDNLKNIALQFQKDSDYDKRDAALDDLLSDLEPEQFEDAMLTYQSIEEDLLGVA